MNDRIFDSPVFVKNGNTLIQEIACLEDALEFLYEWPKKAPRADLRDRASRLPARVRQRLSVVRCQAGIRWALRSR